MTTERNQPDLEDGFPAGIDHTDALLDEALRETFPASDPIAISASKENPMTTAERTPRESTIYGGEAVLVERLLPAARERLVTIAGDAPLLEAARLLRAGLDLVVVCGLAGTVAGVITKTDVVACICECGGAACTMAADLVMSTDVLLCTPGDLLRDVWSKMKARGLKNVPIIGADGRPAGVLTARDALGVLMQGVKDEESLLRDYVMGVGYR